MRHVKDAYLIWISIVPHIEKRQRYTIGDRIGNMLLDLAEQTYEAYFSNIENRPLKVERCILTNDKIKFLLSIAWEGRLMSNQHYENISTKVQEIGKILGGWRKSLENPDRKNQSFKDTKKQRVQTTKELNL